jgi:hypothetical protein
MVAPMYEHHALVPNADRSALLAVHGRPTSRAESGRAINAAFEPDDRWLFADAYDEWMQRAHRLAGGALEISAAPQESGSDPEGLTLDGKGLTPPGQTRFWGRRGNADQPG